MCCKHLIYYIFCPKLWPKISSFPALTALLEETPCDLSYLCICLFTNSQSFISIHIIHILLLLFTSLYSKPPIFPIRTRTLFFPHLGCHHMCVRLRWAFSYLRLDTWCWCYPHLDICTLTGGKTIQSSSHLCLTEIFEVNKLVCQTQNLYIDPYQKFTQHPGHQCQLYCTNSINLSVMHCGTFKFDKILSGLWIVFKGLFHRTKKNQNEPDHGLVFFFSCGYPNLGLFWLLVASF